MARCGWIALGALAVVGIVAVRAAAADRESPERASAEVQELRRAAEKAEQHGQKDRAAQLRRKAEELGAKLRARPEGHPEAAAIKEHVARVKKQIGVLMEMAGMAEQNGMGDLAAGLRRHADQLERELRDKLAAFQRQGGEARERALARAREMREKAEALERAGKPEAAAELRRAAERLEGEAGPRPRPPEMPPFAREIMAHQVRLERHVAELTEQVRALREEVARLRESIGRAPAPQIAHRRAQAQAPQLRPPVRPPAPPERRR